MKINIQSLNKMSRLWTGFELVNFALRAELQLAARASRIRIASKPRFLFQAIYTLFL